MVVKYKLNNSIIKEQNFINFIIIYNYKQNTDLKNG